MDHTSTNGSPFMSPLERKRMFPPRKVYEDLVDKTVEIWKQLGGGFQFAGMTPDELSALVGQARKAQQVELDAKIRVREARDARIRADHSANRALRLVRRMAIAFGKDHPQIAESFSFLIEALTTGQKAASQGTQPAPPGQPAATA